MNTPRLARSLRSNRSDLTPISRHVEGARRERVRYHPQVAPPPRNTAWVLFARFADEVERPCRTWLQESLIWISMSSILQNRGLQKLRRGARDSARQRVVATNLRMNSCPKTSPVLAGRVAAKSVRAGGLRRHRAASIYAATACGRHRQCRQRPGRYWSAEYHDTEALGPARPRRRAANHPRRCLAGYGPDLAASVRSGAA